MNETKVTPMTSRLICQECRCPLGSLFPYFAPCCSCQCVGYGRVFLAAALVDVKKVTLVGIPRDGTEKDIVVYSETFDPTVAEQAFAWLEEIKTLTEAPAPEREPVSFCARYCEFYGSLCGGKGKDLAGEMITDPDQEKAAKTYVEISAKIKALEVEKDGAKAALEGVNGITFDGIKVAWSEIAGRKSPDLEQIEKVLGQVPMKEGQPSNRLTVK
jgi:hypothetical protein